TRPPRALVVAGVILVLAVLAIVYFDLSTTVAMNDEYAYFFSVRNLGGRGIYPAQSALALPQIFLAWLVSAPFAHDSRVIRASMLLLALPGSWAAYRLARRLGAGSTWSLITPAVMLTSPIYFNLAVSFMSDVAYVSLMLLACNAGVAWLEGERSQRWFALWAVLATFQRIFGLALPLGLAAAIVLAHRRGRAVAPSEIGWLAITLVGSSLSLVVPGLLGASAAGNVADQLAHFQLAGALTPLVHVPVVLGYLLLPLVFAVGVSWSLRLGLFAAATGAVVLGLVWLFPWLPGNIWTFVGPAPTLAGYKPAPVPLAANLLLIALSPVAFWLLGPVAWGRWTAAARGDSRFVFLLAVSGIQLLLLVPNTVTFFDRYYLPVAAPLLPMIGALAERHARPGAAVIAVAIAALMLVVACVYEQDYESWQSARDQAARLAYRCAPPSRVNAGYEANATYVAVPAYEATGVEPVARVSRNSIIFGPPNPDLWLTFAGPEDSRAGVPYSSAAPGKVAINGAVCAALTAR
ncbi:MAG TPA: glycosyltransferase family 39 protein, partial [Candidatus Dormibacteraeota bacterium]|nr:glycosyltransferase family 39 protein [Candidatus Dormibacteraeota bacterium]